MPDPSPTRAGYLQVSLASLGVALATVAMASLAALVVVASVQNADTLSTVALALAVIAFVAQLIVFVVQANAAGAQMTQSQELHGRLQHLLGEMGERTRGTDETVKTINEQLIAAVLGKRLTERGGIPNAPGELQQLAQDVSAAVASDDEGGLGAGFLPRSPTLARILQ